MPVSGNDETGVKPVSWKYSDYTAGVPIKKRRFPMMRPPSPPPEEPSLPPAMTDSVHKEPSLPPAKTEAIHKEPSLPPAMTESVHKEPSLPPAMTEAIHKEPSLPPAMTDSVHKEPSLPPAKTEAIHKEPSLPPAMTESVHKEPSLPPAMTEAIHKEPSLPPAMTDSVHKEPSLPPAKTEAIHKEPSLPPAKKESIQKEQSSQLEGSTISNASIATSSQVSDATKVPESNDTSGSSDMPSVNMVKGNDSIVRVKVEQPIGKVHLSPSEELQRKGKFVMTDNPVPEMNLGRNLLNWRPTESPVSSLNKDIMHGKHLAVVKREEVAPATGESIGLSLSLKEHRSPALTSQKSDTRLTRLSSEPVSLSLSLTEEKISSQSKANAGDMEVDGAQMQSCRANWDLNTPIDAWEDSFNDTPSSVDQIKAKGAAHGLSSIGMSEGGVSSERRIISENHRRTDSPVLSKLGSQQSKSNESLLLRLSSNSLPNLSQRPSSSIGSNLPSRDSAKLPRVAGPTSNLNLGNHRIVKAEPFDGSVKQEPNSMVPLNFRAVKLGVVELPIVGAIKSSNENIKKVVDPKSIKSEPAMELNQDMSNSAKGKSVLLYKHLINGLDGCSSGMKLPVVTGISGPVGKPSSELTVTQDVTNHSGESSGKMSHEACQSTENFAIAIGHDNKVNNFRNKDDKKVDSPSSKLRLMNFEPLDSRGSHGTSDDGKLNISTGTTDVSNGTDYESDANHIIETAVQTKQEGIDDYEGGKVSDSCLGAVVKEEFMCEARPQENANFKNERTVCARSVDIVHETSNHVEAKDIKIDNLAGTSKESWDVAPDSEPDNGCDNDTCMQERSFAEKVRNSEALKGSVSTVTTEPLNDEFEMKDSHMCRDVELSSEQVTLGNPESALSTALVTELNGNATEPVQRSESTLSKTSGSADNGTKDRGQRSRIITLPRSLNGSPSRSLSILGQSVPSRGGTDMLPDVTADDEELLPGRGETYVDDMYRFPRERYQDQSWRSSGVNFRFRGRMSNRGGHLNSDCYLAAERHYNQTKYRIPRYKYINDVSDPDLEYNYVSMASDDASFGGRGGTKFSNDGQINHRIPSRRRSPIGEQIVHVPRGNQRKFSPGRCDDEETSGLVGTRHNEKFMRGFPDDSVDPMFNRAQNSYDGNGQFGRGRGRWRGRGRGRGNRDYSFIERRGFRDRSKSPIRTRTRSPGSWSSPRGRFSDGFGGRGEHGPHYRMQRFRSPDEASFTGEMVVRRDMPNDLRDMDSGRGRGNQRWGIQRSSSGVVLRNRRFDVTNPRERTENNEFFVGGGGPEHSGRVHEFRDDGNGDDRRRFSERRGPVRTFRPPYNTADEETFQDNTEDDPKPFRFCQDGETEFQERGNLRDRDTDRRIKNRPGSAPKRIRSIEDQEGSFMSDGQQWNNGGFDDISQAKRKRF